MTTSTQCTQGDATEPTVWLHAFGERRFDLLLTDPPYCILTRRRKHGDERDKKNKKIERGPLRRFENVREYSDFTTAWMRNAAAHSTPDAPWIIWTNLLGRAPIRQAAASFGFSHLIGEFVWGKRTREGNSGEEILRVVETALVLTRAPAPALQAHDIVKPWAVVAAYDPDGEAVASGNHPSHKPFSVLEPLLRSWSLPSALVADPFSGSGSIASAAKRLERHCLSFELEESWVQMTNQRLHPQRNL